MYSLLYVRHFRVSLWLSLPSKTGTSASSAQNTTKLKRLLPYETVAVHILSGRFCEAKLNFVNLYLRGVRADGIHPTVVVFNDEAYSLSLRLYK
jgi:hypothetical protein